MTVRIGHWLVRRLPLTVLLAALLSGTVAAPTAAFAATAVHADTVVGSCHISGCSAALTAYHGWGQLGWPTSRGWYSWPYGKYNFAGGRYYNNDRQLPSGHSYQEYDVYPRSYGAHRDAYRIVREDTGSVWYSPDHYSTFYRLV